MSSTQCINLLKDYCFNINENILAYEDQNLKFFEFLANSIEKDNVLQNYDLSEFAILEKDEIFENSQLKSRCDLINQKYPNIFSTNDDDIQLLEQELKEYSEIERIYENIRMEQKPLLNALSEEFSELESQQSSLIYNVSKLYAEITRYSKEIIAIQQSNNTQLNELESYFYNQSQTPNFITQFPLNTHVERIKEFYAKCDFYMQKNVKTDSENHNTSSYNSNYESCIAEFDALKTRLMATRKKLVENQMSHYAKQRVIYYIKTYKPTQIEYKSLKDHTEMMQRAVKQSTNFLNALRPELDVLVNELVEQKMEIHATNLNLNKIERAKKRLIKMNDMYERSSRTFDTSELLWIIQQIDSGLFFRLNQLQKHDRLLQTQNEGYTRRCMILKTIAEQSDPRAEMAQCRIPMNNLRMRLGVVTYRDVVEVFMQQKESVKHLINGIFHKNSYSKISATDSIVSDRCSKLSIFLNDGPLNAVQLSDLKYQQEMNKCRKVLELITNDTKELRARFRQELGGKMVSDKLFCYRHLLWVWFLVSPKKVIHAIDEIKKKAADKSEM